jgi:SAM-dependent methyltransferase
VILPGDARSTYDGACDHFDDAPLGFWDRHGQGTIARLGLPEGARVLDVCCGAGASALPSARAVGPGGSVTGVDLSGGLVALARRKAEREGLGNLDFRVADMTSLLLPGRSFDAVVIVFGIFFAPDMEGQLRALARLVRPGGKLAVTTWGPGLFEPLYVPFLAAFRRLRPGLPEYRPWDRISAPEELAGLMSRAGLRDLAIKSESDQQPLAGPEDWWTIVRGTGLRWFVDQLDPDGAEALRAGCHQAARGIRSVATNVIYAVARVRGPMTNEKEETNE